MYLADAEIDEQAFNYFFGSWLAVAAVVVSTS